ncbi:MAG: hypothetical protein JXA92_00245 [candidate division Zixibacteria bacterium]|nr:hypothetical protein [candidate division Zixibacteria bacterium]
MILHLYLIWQQSFYPFLDMPNHLAAAAVLKNMGDITNNFNAFYNVELFFQPNVFHLLFCASDIFPLVETANTVFLSLYVLLLPLATLMIINRLNGNAWYSLLSFLFLYNFNISFGFVGFAFAVPLLLIFLCLLLDYPGENPFARRTMVGSFLVLLYFVHVLAMLFALLMFLTFCLYFFRRSLKRFFAEILPALPVTALVLAWWFLYHDDESPGLTVFLGDYYLHEFFQTFIKRARLIALDNYSLFNRYTGYAVGIFFTLAATVPSLYALYIRRETIARALKKPAATSVFIFIFCALLCFFLLPEGLPGQGYLYQRFAVILILGIIAAGGSFASPKISKIKTVALLTVCLLHFGLYYDYFTAFDRENEGFAEEIISEIPTDKILVGLIADNLYRGHPMYFHFPNYFIVRRQGIAASCITKYRFGIIRRKMTEDILPVYDELARDTTYISGNYEKADYLLIRGELPPVYKPLLNSFKLVKSLGKWFIYDKIIKSEEAG